MDTLLQPDLGSITAGVGAVTGTIVASSIFGTVRQLVTYETTPIIGGVVLLIVAVILLRLLPQGITGRIFRRSL